MTRLMGIVLLAAVAAGSAACDNPVAPSSISNPAAFRNTMEFVPDPASSCAATARPGQTSRPAKC